MYNLYMLSYSITDEQVKKLKEISDISAEKLAFLSTQDEECKEAIKKYARISNIGATTRIENAVLTDTEILWMEDVLNKDEHPTAFLKEKTYIENKLSKERERSIEEVAGCRAMMDILYEQIASLFPLSHNTICGLHRELLQYYAPAQHYSGRYKTVPNNVIERLMDGAKELSRKDVLKTADPGPITETAMNDLIEWHNKTLPEYPWAAAVATELAFRFLAIHPFQDGNGRIGRALFVAAILQSNDRALKAIAPFIAIDRHIEKSKREYYLVLRQCSDGKFSPDPKAYDLGHFLNFMLKVVRMAVENDIDFYAKKYHAFIELADAPRKVLASFKEYPEKRLGMKEVLNLTNLPRRTAVNATNTLLKKNFLQKYGRGPATKYQLIF
jgi:Fic family protein